MCYKWLYVCYRCDIGGYKLLCICYRWLLVCYKSVNKCVIRVLLVCYKLLQVVNKCVIICSISGYNFTHNAIRGGLCVVLVVLCVV